MLSTGASTSCAARPNLSEIYFVARDWLPISLATPFGLGIDLDDRFREILEHLCRPVARAAHTFDKTADSFRRPRRLVGQALQFGRDDGETFTSFACPRGFDRGIERQKVGLRRYVADQLTSLSDLARRSAEASRSGRPHSKPARQRRSRPNSYPAFRLRPSR